MMRGYVGMETSRTIIFDGIVGKDTNQLARRIADMVRRT
jgi:hypothetical protein